MVPVCTLLSQPELETIYEHVTTFLAERGVQVQHNRLLKRLEQAGAHVDRETEMVRFPAALIEQSLRSIPGSFHLSGVGEGINFPLPAEEETFFTCTTTGGRGILDPERDVHRDLTLDDIALWGRLAGELTNIDLCAFPTPTDAPPETVDVHALSTLLRNTSKHVWIQPHTEETLPFLLELAAARAGGRENFAKKPCASIIACALTPFRFKSMDMEVLLQAAEIGMPVHLSSLPVIGGTAPVTTMGTVLVAGIEVLAMLVISQIIKPGMPVVGLATSLHMDMKTGRAQKAALEAMKANAASSQFIRSMFRIPTHTAACTSDMKTTGGQALIEHSVFSFMVAAARTDILGRAGELEAAKTASPLQLIIDNEIIGMVRHLKSDTGSADDSSAFQDVLDTPPGGHFLESPHTLEHCRDAFEPELLKRLGPGERDEGGHSELLDRAHERYREIKPLSRKSEVPGEIEKNMESIVRDADRSLAKMRSME